MKSSEYWKKRALFAKKKQLEASADYEAAMQSRLRDLEHDIEKEALGYLQRYANENHVGLKQAASVLGNINSTKWSMTLEEFERKAKAGGYEKELNAEYYKSRIFRLQQLHEQMVEFSKKYGMAEQLRMQNGLAKQYQNSYYLDAYNKYRATGQLDIKLNHFNEQQLENIVYRPWKGSDFSKRIWKEYTEVLPDELTDALLRGTLFGYSPSKVVRMMRDRFQKVSERDLHRLVITEMGHAAEEATAQFYKDSDIEQYQYLATLESHTCDQCAHLDERIFNVKDKKEGINYPLIHPYCRCTTVPYDKDLPDIETRWSRDPKTGKGTYVKDMNYQQWERMTSQKTLGYQDWKKITGVKILSLGMLSLFASGAKYYPAYDETEISMNQEQRRQNNFARMYYKQLRNSDRQKQIDRVTQSSDLSRDIVSEALIHVLDSKYDLLDYKTMEYVRSNFAPEIDMAHSLQRLINGNSMDHDILLLQHEALEAKLMDNPNGKYYGNYGKAHKEANKKYNYQKACVKLRVKGVIPDYESEQEGES
ncbi:MAG: minor capsid protein [Lactobacillus johnsonii]|nr:minor capsid protein [Lactobacillus johnsonii]